MPRSLRLLVLALAASGIAPTVCRAAPGTIPGYVVVPLIPVGTQAAGIHATIDGHATSLIVDTGASQTVLDSHLYKGVTSATAAKPASVLPPGFPTKATANGLPVDIGQIQNLQAGDMHFGNGPVVVLDLSVLTNTYRAFNVQHRDAPIGGLIGEDVLRTYGAIIDWNRRGIYFNTQPARRLHLSKSLPAAGWTPIAMDRTNQRHFSVPVTIAQRPFQLIVDTGAAFTSVDSGLLGTRDVTYGRGLLRMNMLGSSALGRPVILNDIAIGNYHVCKFPVVAENLPKAMLEESGSDRGPTLGLMGSELLFRNHAIIDVAGSTLYLKP